MKIDDQESCEYRFSSIFIDFHQFYLIVIATSYEYKTQEQKRIFW